MKQTIKKILPSFLLNAVRKSKRFYQKRQAKAKRNARLKQYAGDNVKCPFCKKHFSGFCPTGALERPFWKTPEAQELLKLDYINVANAICPWCGSGERHRALYFYFRDRLRFAEQKGISILDVAPDGFLTEKFFQREDLEYISIDMNAARKPTIIMNMKDMHFNDARFDAIICYHVLEHIPDDMAAIKEMFRVLKPGGWAIVQVPVWAEKTVENPTASREQYALLYGHPCHVRRCGTDYVGRIEAAGFQVQCDEYIKTLSTDHIRRFGLFETEEFWLCTKS